MKDLETIKADIKQTIATYVKEKRDRSWPFNGVAVIREAEIDHIEKEILAKARTSHELIFELQYYITQMKKPSFGILTQRLRECICRAYRDDKYNRDYAAIDQKAKSDLPRPYVARFRTPSMNQVKIAREAKIWGDQYYGATIKAIEMAAVSSEHLELLEIYLGPNRYSLNLRYSQNTLDKRFQRLDAEIASNLWTCAYKILKPYEEKLYREKVFAQALKHIQAKYEAEQRRSDRQVKITVDGFAYEEKVDAVFHSEFTGATDKASNAIREKAALIADAEYKEFVRVRSVYVGNFDSFTIKTEYFLKFHENKLAVEDQKKFEEYERAALVDRRSLLSSQEIYDLIKQSVAFVIAKTYKQQTADFLKGFEHIQATPELYDAASDYIRLRAEYYYNKINTQVVGPMAWERRPIHDLTRHMEDQYARAVNKLQGYGANADSNYVHDEDKVNDSYTRKAANALAKHSKVKEFKSADAKLSDSITRTNVGTIQPNYLSGNSGTLVDFATLNYMGTHAINKQKAFAALELILLRGGTMTKSPIYMISGENPHDSLIHAWKALYISLQNINTVTQVCGFVRRNMLAYCEQSIAELTYYNSYFRRKYIHIEHEKIRLDKTFKILEHLIEARYSFNDTDLVEYIKTLKCDLRPENGVYARSRLTLLAQQFDAAISAKNMFTVQDDILAATKFHEHKLEIKYNQNKVHRAFSAWRVLAGKKLAAKKPDEKSGSSAKPLAALSLVVIDDSKYPAPRHSSVSVVARPAAVIAKPALASVAEGNDGAPALLSQAKCMLFADVSPGLLAAEGGKGPSKDPTATPPPATPVVVSMAAK